ncbi:hypothetical protein D9613_000527 [Agrocybe pediades]|uniref:RING-type domain-containing protein n=1 Tax=Agrocybe pediades TaxID=84607 RepID=A0A8H4VV23_9AGAR|nr:hypothetical protein D9613_000527 [Agrocybe pediades]
MPPTRSSSIQPRQHPFPSASPPRKHQPTQLIDLSSEPDPCVPTNNKVPLPVRRQNKATHKKAPVAPVPPNEVIEISSDDDSLPKSSEASRIADLRRQANKSREELVKYKREYERATKALKEAQEESKRLQSLLKPDSGKISLDLHKLAENLDCEICTGRMWTPYILPDCGHSFCQSCLVDWFGTTQAQFLQAHPEQDGVRQNQAQQVTYLLHSIATNPALAQHPHVREMVAHLVPPTPQYTCPSCREVVRSRPTEVFAFKNIARTISAAAGEENPEKAASSSRKAKVPAAGSSPWDGFFPTRKL